MLRPKGILDHLEFGLARKHLGNNGLGCFRIHYCNHRLRCRRPRVLAVLNEPLSDCLILRSKILLLCRIAQQRSDEAPASIQPLQIAASTKGGRQLLRCLLRSLLALWQLSLRRLCVRRRQCLLRAELVRIAKPRHLIIVADSNGRGLIRRECLRVELGIVK